MINRTYNYVLVAHDGSNFYPVYSSNDKTVVENIMWAVCGVCGQKDGFNKINKKRLKEFLILNRIKLVDQLEDKGIPAYPDWRISPSSLLKELDKKWDCWDMFLLTFPAVNF